jgi:hypothetical protein
MTTQPEALRLADALTKYLGGNTATQAAAELRRLSAVNGELLEALRQIAKIGNQPYGTDYEEIDAAREIARAAIARAEGEKT